MKTDARGENLSGGRPFSTVSKPLVCNWFYFPSLFCVGFAQSVALARVFLRLESQLIIVDEALGQVHLCNVLTSKHFSARRTNSDIGESFDQ